MAPGREIRAARFSVLEDHSLVVGRSWQENPNKGPKMILMVIGLQNGDFKNEVEALENRQLKMDNSLKQLQERIQRLEKVYNKTQVNSYATKN